MKCRACFECRQFITVQDNYASQLREAGFDQQHICHPRGTTDHTELTGYMNVNFLYTRHPQINTAEKANSLETT